MTPDQTVLINCNCILLTLLLPRFARASRPSRLLQNKVYVSTPILLGYPRSNRGTSGRYLINPGPYIGRTPLRRSFLHKIGSNLQISGILFVNKAFNKKQEKGHLSHFPRDTASPFIQPPLTDPVVRLPIYISFTSLFCSLCAIIKYLPFRVMTDL